MENFDYRDYRDDLAKDLKELRSKGEEGKEDAQFLLDGVGGTSTFKESEKLHFEERQKHINTRSQERKEWLHEAKVEKMKEIVKELPFEYISVPASKGHLGAVLLKINDTKAAFLVGNDLERHGSDYGIIAGGAKIFMLCGCRNCGGFDREFVQSIVIAAKEKEISEIIARFADDYTNIGVNFVEVEKLQSLSSSSTISSHIYSTLKEKQLLPTYATMEND